MNHHDPQAQDSAEAKLITSIAAGVAAIALASGGYVCEVDGKCV